MSLTQVGGTETWTRTMAEELSKNHEVTVFTKVKGRYAEDVLANFNVIDKYTGDYDLAIVNHRPCFDDIPTSLYRIFTSHSYIFDVEQFPENADRYVAVTEELTRGRKDVTIIRNGINLEKFRPTNPVNKTIKNVLYLAKFYDKPALPTIHQACKQMGLNLTVIYNAYDVENHINEADLVITHGRGLLESMACGRNVISADQRAYMDSFSGAGTITEENFDHYKTHAFSGRNDIKTFNVETLKAEIAKYDPDRGMKLKKKVEAEYDIRANAQKYLDLWTNTK